jgi:diguanylate cyclase (GGDEF)-like protein
MLAALFLSLLYTGTAHADTVDLVPCVAAVKDGDTPQSVLSQKSRFVCGPSQTHFAPGDYWVRMEVPRQVSGANEDLIFRTMSLWDDGIEFTAFHADGSTRQYSSDPKAVPNPMRLGATQVVRFHNHGPALQTILARVDNSMIVRGVMHQPQLSSIYSSLQQELGLAALYAAFAGICLALLVYNAALWRAMRERFLLAYCCMVGSMLVYSVFTSGAPHYFVDGWTGGDRLRTTIPLLALTAATGMWFISCFFTASPTPRWLRRITLAQIVLLPVAGLCYALFGPLAIKFFDQLYMFSFVPLPALVACYLAVAWRHRDPFLPYFLLAWSLPMLSVVMRLLRGFDLVPPTTVVENSTLIGLAFEALVSSLAIGYRVRLLAQARDRAEIAEAHAMNMADTDPLTGLLNRRAFLRSLLERQSKWTLVLLDIDHFKRVNDSLGHDGGDEALVRIGTALSASAPDAALVARLGGEEFAVAYLGDKTSIEPDDLLSVIRQIDLPHGYRITASMGIATRNVATEHDWKILYRAADLALYEAKTGGRDRFIRMQPQSIAA